MPAPVDEQQRRRALFLTGLTQGTLRLALFRCLSYRQIGKPDQFRQYRPALTQSDYRGKLMIDRIASARMARALLLAVLASVTLSGCLSAKMYVDPKLPTVSKTDIPVVPTPQPVQVLFEFRTKGNANVKATTQMEPRILSVASASGLFSNVSTAAQANPVGTLKITIDNIPLTDNATAKGFGTGLTFGLAGSMVTDGYVYTAAYTRAGQTTETTVKHALYTTIGNHSAPMGLTAMQPLDAIDTAVDQMTWNALKQLADKHAFD